ncbi:uncharacterized protein LOC123312062 [Coccinella septempunctata]|uniref:uncharacterized protein LOC123312062 n=1 Tax=Coccinella septempunctata TaxID=41139 RepID=UPI001D07BDDC|nr:uncharacterized protein LOC123312062 [Coccinella septempunctata]
MKPLTLPVPPNEIFHLWTGMVGTGDGRGSGSNGTLSLVMVLPELTQDVGDAVPQSCDWVTGNAGICRSNAVHVRLVSFMTCSNVLFLTGVPVCETSAPVGRLTPSPRSIRDVSALSGWIGDIPGELGTSISKRDRSC